MNEMILDNFYKTVNRGDTVYFLGDFAFSTKAHLNDIREVLTGVTSHCKFHMILGNHDYAIRELLEKQCTSVTPLRVIEAGEYKISLCHYPMHSFSGSHHNNWQLYGHHHRDTNTEIPGKRYNVCLEANDYKPISFEKLLAIMRERGDNWDYITPERIKRRKEEEKAQRDLAKARKILAVLREKMTDDFLANAPEYIVSELKAKIDSEEKRIQELEGEAPGNS